MHRTAKRKSSVRHVTKKNAGKKWSAGVTAHSNALDLEKDVFKSGSAEEVAESLKRSADKSKRRKAKPFQSAMSMLNFYINRAGKGLSARRKAILENAKDKLRKLYGKNAER